MNDEVIKTDRESQSMLAIAIQADEPIPTWKINDTTFVALSVEELKELGKVIKAHVQFCFDREAELSEQITAAETVEEVNAITWAD